MDIRTIKKQAHRTKNEYKELRKILSMLDMLTIDFKEPINLNKLCRINVQFLVEDVFKTKRSNELSEAILERLYEATPMVDDSVDFI